MARTPDYVRSVQNSNETATFINGRWILQHRTSRYDRKTKKAISVLIPVAIVTKDGRMPYEEQKIVEVAEFESYEFGLSFALKHLIPKQWLSSLKGDGEAIFLDLIRKTSPSSYLLMSKEINLPRARNVDLQQERFWHKLGGKEKLNELSPLKDIRLIIFNNKMSVQKPNEVQQKILDSYSLSLEGSFVL